MIFYVDTSGFAKLFRTELGSEVIKALHEESGAEETFVANQIISVEMESIAARAFKARAFDQPGYYALLEEVYLKLDDFVLLPLSPGLANDAALCARRRSLRALDALHLASALRVQRISPRSTVLVTSDKELLNAGLAEGLQVLNPEDSHAMEQLNTLRG